MLRYNNKVIPKHIQHSIIQLYSLAKFRIQFNYLELNPPSQPILASPTIWSHGLSPPKMRKTSTPLKTFLRTKKSPHHRLGGEDTMSFWSYIFHTLFWYFYCWLWTRKCPLGRQSIERLLYQWGFGLKWVNKKDPTIQFKVHRALELDPDQTTRLLSLITTLEHVLGHYFHVIIFMLALNILLGQGLALVSKVTVLNVNFKSLIVQWIVDFDLYYVEQICIGYHKFHPCKGKNIADHIVLQNLLFF